MSARKLILLIIALVIAGGTVILARSMMTSPAGGDAAKSGAKISNIEEVLVAARDLPAGTLVKETDLKWQPWPIGSDTTGLAIKGKVQMSDFAGSVVRQGLRAGEPIISGRVVKKNEQGFMAAVLNPGMRAVSVPITAVGGVAGFIFPGDYVDVIVTHQIKHRRNQEDSDERKVSETVLTNVRVLALDQRMSDQATEPKIAQTATLEVTPKQAETLVLLTHIGTLSLSLRSLAGGAEEIPPLSQATLEAAEKAASMENIGDVTWDSDVSKVLSKPANRQGKMQRIQIIRGKDSSEAVFELRQ